jgi:hypothetical protein
MTTHDAFRDPLLLGGANPLLLVASVAVGLLLWTLRLRLRTYRLTSCPLPGAAVGADDRV